YNLVRGKAIDLEKIKNVILNSESEYETLKQDIDMNFYKTKSESNINTIFNLLDDIYNNISTLSKIKIQSQPSLTVENIQLMQELYNLAIFTNLDYELDNNDI